MQSSINSKRSLAIQVILLATILLFALLLRVVLYSGMICCDHYDYAYLAFDASHGNVGIKPDDLRGVTPRLSIYIPIGFMYWLFGPSGRSTLIYPLLTALLGVVFIYGIGRLLAGETTGLIAALIWAALPLGVFLSTSVGPDSLLASFSLGSVFFLLLGSRHQGWRAILYFGLAFFTVIIGIFVKPLGVITLLFVLLYLLFHYSKKNIRLLTLFKQHKRIILWSSLTLLCLFIAGDYAFNLLSNKDGLLLDLFQTATDFSANWLRGQTTEILTGGRWLLTSVLLVPGILFLLSVLNLDKLKNPYVWFLLLWFLVHYVYYEIGSTANNPFIYQPLSSYRDDRNFLFILAPFCVIVSIYLGGILNKQTASVAIPIACVLGFSLTYISILNSWNPSYRQLLSWIAALTILGTFALPFAKQVKPYLLSQVFVGTFLVVFVAGLQFPSTPYHISDLHWKRELNYKIVVRKAATFLLQENLQLPILALSRSNAQELDFASDFKLGFQDQLLRTQLPEARIIVAEDLKAWSDSAYVYLRDEINQIQPVPSNWWRVARFPTDSDKPLLIYRILSPKDAQTYLDQVKPGRPNTYSAEELETYLGAAINAQDGSNIVNALLLLEATTPKNNYFELAAPSLINLGVGAYHGENLLSSNDLSDRRSIKIDLPLQPYFIEDPTNPRVASFDLPTDLGGRFGIYEELELEPASAYLLSILVKSNTGVDILRVDNGRISDTYNQSGTFSDWQVVSAVFITPNWDQPQMVRLDYFTVNKSGSISFTDPQLYRLDFGEN